MVLELGLERRTRFRVADLGSGAFGCRGEYGEHRVDSTRCVKGKMGHLMWWALAVSGGSRLGRAQSSMTGRASSLGSIEIEFHQSRGEDELFLGHCISLPGWL